jgi:rod shape-determining protein MreB
MIGKAPRSIQVVRPMRGGVISDFETSRVMLKSFMNEALKTAGRVKPRVIICIPYGVTAVEKRAVREASRQAGARETYLIEEPMAAAIGAGLPVSEPNGAMIVDIGGGTTEVAVISLGGIVYSKSVRVAGDNFDLAIINYIKKKHSLVIGENMAEKVKVAIANVYIVEGDEIETFDVKGLDLITSGPKTVTVNSREIQEALTDSIVEIIEAIKICLEKTPPELASDIVDNGIVLTGGGALLKNLDTLIREETGLPVAQDQDPLTCVVRGCGILLDSFTLLKQLAI